MKSVERLSIFLLMCLTACSGSSGNTVTAIPTVTYLSIKTLASVSTLPAPSSAAIEGLPIDVATLSLIPTGRPTLRWVTPKPSRTPTMTPIPETRVQCLEIGAEVPLESVAARGTVVIFPLHSSGYLLNLSTGEQYDLPSQLPDDAGINGLEVSPDGIGLAYVESEENQASDTLWIITANGQVQVTVPFDKDWSWWRWLDNERLEAYWYNAPIAGTVIVLNPFTGEKETIAPTFPNLYNANYDPPYWMVIYSPSLEWVLYLSNGDNTYRSGAVVWDVMAGRALWQLSGHNTSHNWPAWSPQGDQVAVVVGGTLYRVNRAGESITLPDIRMENIRNFGWSPDGDHIYLWASAPPWETERLFILDTETNQVTDYCIDGTTPHGKPPLWSPDSQQLLVDVTLKEPDGSLNGLIALIDIRQGKAYEIKMSDADFPLVWMNSTP